MQKIKRNTVLQALSIILFLFLFFSRIINISWGLPYPFHPDERNMAVALMNLRCDFSSISECMNPHFFAYGQLSLYIGYLLVMIVHVIHGIVGKPISYHEAVLALRIIAVISSVMTVYISIKILELIINNRKDTHKASLLRYILFKDYYLVIIGIIFIFVPGLIQSAHFGTTESLLMFFYVSILYLSLLFLYGHIFQKTFLILSSVATGLSVGTKISAVIFLILPLAVLLLNKPLIGNRILRNIKVISLFLLLTAITGILSSPFNLIDFDEFMNSMRYESAVALGTISVFYTRQFFETLPVFFQFIHIFPYTLGWPIMTLFILGFITIPSGKGVNLLRAAFLIYFISNAFLYTKWIRFMVPIFPIMVIFAALFILYIRQILKKRLRLSYFLVGLLLFFSVLPGISFISGYFKEDTRVSASKWMNKNIPKNTLVLSESANVIDLPLTAFNSYVIPFDFYNLDTNPVLAEDLQILLRKVNYIVVPSRRVYMNHTCEKDEAKKTLEEYLIPSYYQKRCLDLQKRYPLLNNYYRKLFDGSLGFRKVAEFSNQYIDEQAEETWNVFDHPAIRIYKRL